MKTIKYKWIMLLIVLALIVLATVYLTTRSEDVGKYQRKAEEIANWVKAKNANFNLEGTIEDQDGKSLDKVKIDIRKIISRGFDESIEKSQKIYVDKSFAIRENGYSALYPKIPGL